MNQGHSVFEIIHCRVGGSLPTDLVSLTLQDSGAQASGLRGQPAHSGARCASGPFWGCAPLGALLQGVQAQDLTCTTRKNGTTTQDETMFPTLVKFSVYLLSCQLASNFGISSVCLWSLIPDHKVDTQQEASNVKPSTPPYCYHSVFMMSACPATIPCPSS